MGRDKAMKADVKEDTLVLIRGRMVKINGIERIIPNKKEMENNNKRMNVMKTKRIIINNLITVMFAVPTFLYCPSFHFLNY